MLFAQHVVYASEKGHARDVFAGLYRSLKEIKFRFSLPVRFLSAMSAREVLGTVTKRA